MAKIQIGKPEVPTSNRRLGRKAGVPVPTHKRVADLNFIPSIHVSLHEQATLICNTAIWDDFPNRLQHS